LRAKKYDEAKDRWQARVNKDWRFYFKIEGDTYFIVDLIPLRQEPRLKPQRPPRRILLSSSAFGLLHSPALFYLGFEVGDHIINGIEGTVERTFFSFIELGVNDTPLCGRIFLIGRW